METYSYDKPSFAYHEHYVRNSRAVGVLWAILSVCFAVIAVLVFVQPQWIGSVVGDSQGVGLFGLYQYCVLDGDVDSFGTGDCSPSVVDFGRILSTPFRIATILVGLSALASILSVLCIPLFLLLSSRAVYCLCAWLQLFSFVCLTAGCSVYPAGWNQELVREVCGSNEYWLGSCQLRWAYILAIIGVIDVFLLSILAFNLACRQVKILPQQYPWNRPEDVTFGAYGQTGSLPVEALDQVEYTRRDSGGRHLQL